MKPHKRKDLVAKLKALAKKPPLRVKFFAFKSNLVVDSRSYNGSFPSENAVNEWLTSNPGIRIVEIRQSMCQMSNDNFATTLITVWYEGAPPAESPAEEAPPAVEPPSAFEPPPGS
jgi:hypothetical protein